MILVPGEDSSTGNVTGGRKLARYVFKSLINARAESAEIYLADEIVSGSLRRCKRKRADCEEPQRQSHDNKQVGGVTFKQ